MNAKICASPKSGSGRGAVRYILGYSLGSNEKDETMTKDDRRAAFDRLQAEGFAREDLGVGTMWEPLEGREGRPAAILAMNVTSLITADQEMDAWAELAKRSGVREPTMHLVYSWSPDESKLLTREQMMAQVWSSQVGLGLGDHATVMSLHEDTAHFHVHVAVSSINPKTLQSFERNRDRFRLSEQVRYAEIKHGTRREKGLYVINRDEATGKELVQPASVAERKAWRREDLEGRLDQQTRKAQNDYKKFESPESWAEVVTYRIRERAEALDDAGLIPTWADAHRIAASYGGRLVAGEDGKILLEVRERIGDKEREKEQDERKAAREAAGEEEYRTDGIDAPRTRATNKFVTLKTDRLGMHSDFEDAERSEEVLKALLKSEPSYVSDVITNVDGIGTFDRSHVDKYIATRITDAEEISELSDYVLEYDSTIAMRTADTEHPTFVKKSLEALELRVVDNAEKLAAQRDNAFDVHAFERSIVSFENQKRDEQTRNGDEATFKLSDEQRALCSMVAMNRFSWCNGEAGAGKTTSMRVLAEYAKGTGREIVGLATSQSAAETLANEAGITTYNLAKVVADERLGRGKIKPGSIILIDESSMASYKALDTVMQLANERGCNVAGIGDSAQIANIEAGSPHEVMRQIAMEHKTYTELREVRRQRGELAWMREEIPLVGEAIRSGDAAGIEKFIQKLDEHGNIVICADRNEAITSLASWFLEKPDTPEIKSIIPVNDRETAKHLNQTIVAGLGLEGTGTKFHLYNGTREIGLGFRLQFKEINKHITGGGVLNGDVGTVSAMKFDERKNRWGITVTLDKDGREVTFDPKAFKKVEWAWAVTTNASQGKTVYRSGTTIDKGSSANSALVGTSRSTNELTIFLAETNFSDAGELGSYLGSRITEDRDVMLLQRTIDKTGGPETNWAKNVLAAQKNLKDPLRQQYVKEQEARRDALDKKRLAILGEQKEQLQKLKDGKEKAALIADVRNKTRGIHEAQLKNSKLTFTEWCVARKPEIERDIERQKALERAREQEREKTRERTRDRRDPFIMPGPGESGFDKPRGGRSR